jgi:hypothetical protein
MYILKWIFDHDLRLNDLIHPPLSQTGDEPSHSTHSDRTLEDFLAPDPTYSRFYFSSTKVDAEHFGLSIYPFIETFFQGLEDHFGDVSLWTTRGVTIVHIQGVSIPLPRPVFDTLPCWHRSRP